MKFPRDAFDPADHLLRNAIQRSFANAAPPRSTWRKVEKQAVWQAFWKRGGTTIPALQFTGYCEFVPIPVEFYTLPFQLQLV